MTDYDGFDGDGAELGPPGNEQYADPPGGGTDPGADTEAILRQLAEIIGSSRPMPLSASVLVNKDEVLALVEQAVARFPEELRDARWLLKEREEFLARTRQEADDILAEARLAAGKMVERTEIVREAKLTARMAVDEADAEARRLRHEAEDYCDQKLAAFEVVLDRTLKTVQAGRDKLRVTPLPADHDQGGGLFTSGEGDAPLPPDVGEAFFDQDLG